MHSKMNQCPLLNINGTEASSSISLHTQYISNEMFSSQYSFNVGFCVKEFVFLFY